MNGMSCWLIVSGAKGLRVQRTVNVDNRSGDCAAAIVDGGRQFHGSSVCS
jgi:hypothetical protein